MAMVKDTKALRRGDVILALDGHKLHTPVKVTRFVEVLDDGTVHVEVQQPKEWNTSPDRWLRNDQAEVVREVTLAGLKLYKHDDERYTTRDGEYEIYADHDHTTWCEDRHPVKLNRAMVEDIKRSPDLYPFEARQAADNYRRRDYDTGRIVKGYMCPGGEEHSYTQWVAWRPVAWRPGGGEDLGDATYWVDTPTEAAEQLAAYLNKQAAPKNERWKP